MLRRASARRVHEANRSHSRSMARMSGKAIGDAGRVEHSEIYGLSYSSLASPREWNRFHQCSFARSHCSSIIITQIITP
jgi:hypothetical protein